MKIKINAMKCKLKSEISNKIHNNNIKCEIKLQRNNLLEIHKPTNK